MRRLGVYEEDEEERQRSLKKQKAAPRVVIRQRIKKVGATQYDDPSPWDEEEEPKPPSKTRGRTAATRSKNKAPGKKTTVQKKMGDSSPETQDVIRVATVKMSEHQEKTVPSHKFTTEEDGNSIHVRNSAETSLGGGTDNEREESPLAERSLLMDGVMSSFTDLQLPQQPQAVEPEEEVHEDEVHEDAVYEGEVPEEEVHKPDDSYDLDYVPKAPEELDSHESEEKDHEEDIDSQRQNAPSPPPPGHRGPGRKSFAAAQQFHNELRDEGASDFSDDCGDLPDSLPAIQSKIVDSLNGTQDYLKALNQLLKQQITLLDIQTQTTREPGYYQHLETVLSSLAGGKYPPATETTVLRQLNKILGQIQELRKSDQLIEKNHQRLARRHGRKLANHRKCEDAILKAFDEKRFSGSNDPRTQKAAKDAEKVRKGEQRVERRNREIDEGIKRITEAREVQRQNERFSLAAPQRRPGTSSAARTFEWRPAEAVQRESMAWQQLQREPVASSYSTPRRVSNPTSTARTSFSSVPDVERVAVEGFGERGRARPPVDEEDSEVWEYYRPWGQEESDVVIKGMERFDHLDLDRWAKIKAAYPDVLRNRREGGYCGKSDRDEDCT
jgi:hypothetical protein